MEEKIKSELMKMTIIMIVLLGLGIYAHEFVISGIKAKMGLNLSIFATFGVAAWLAFSGVFKLNNEVLALKALQIDYGKRSRRPLNPYRTPAVVFKEPEMLGQGYRLITEELARQDDLHLQSQTVESIIHSVDQRINDKKATILYFSGLMVFLGLLGAFMGLMKTVQSVGDLIGSMDVSGGAGEDSFGKLIEGMKGPLNGMSVGFSSSLFGLMTSMVLGALERCMSGAMKAMRNEFEHWMSNLTLLESSQESASKAFEDLSWVVRAVETGTKQIDAMRDSVTRSFAVEEGVQKSLASLTGEMNKLTTTVDRVVDPAPLLAPITDAVGDLARNQAVIVGQMQALYDQAADDRRAIREMVAALKEASTSDTSPNQGVEDKLERLIGYGEAIAGKELVLMPAVTVAPTVAGDVGARGLFSQLGAAFGAVRAERRSAGDRRVAAQQQQAVGREVQKLIGEQHKAQRGFLKLINDFRKGRSEERSMIAQLVRQNEAQRAQLAALIDHIAQQGDAATPDAAARLRAARIEMDALQRRMHNRIDDDTPQAQGGQHGH
jgi:hypothetical protein